MPQQGGMTRARRVGRCVALAVSAALATTLPVTGARAALLVFPQEIGGGEVILFVVLIGAVGFAVLSAIAMMRGRSRLEAENARLRHETSGLRAAAERAESLLGGSGERLIAWSGPGEAPFVAGHLPERVGAPPDRASFLAFGTWLQPESAARLDRAIAALRDRGEPFTLVAAATSRRLVEVEGRTIGGLAAVRFRDLSADRLARAEAEARHQLLVAEVDAMRATLTAAPVPAWLRDGKGALVWVNPAYAAAVEAPDEATALTREFLDSAARRALGEAHRDRAVAAVRLPTVVRGARRIFDVVDVVSTGGSAGIAVDATATEAAEAALRRETDFNARTLDQLATAVAIFGPDRRLRSANAAYRELFGLDAAFLESRPDETAVLDRLRSARRLPEQADFRGWRADLLSAWQSPATREFWWHLPDGQTLRVIANPNPQGGMTWVYENVTARLDLEARHNALIRMQGETLDHLSEGVAVFGSNGRLRLHNPSFAAILGVDPALLATEPHVGEIVRGARRPGDPAADWDRVTTSVAGVDESRAGVAGRMERADRRFLDYATVPLPDGQSMVTFVDVTDSVRVERALIERNEALEKAASLKNAFIHHVSYELRSPLTSIIGFTELLADQRIGPLTDRQREYTGYIMSSGSALLAIVNDILDLATIDAGIMELDLAEMDIGATVRAAVEGLRDRVTAAKIRVETRVARDVGSFVGDERRVRQILFNLIANAVAFSPEGGRVTVAAARLGDTVAFTIADEGPGFPADFVDAAFERFASRGRGETRGGVGLGLSIVRSFVTLHGGSVTIESAEGDTRVTVRLPLRPPIVAAAAE